MLFVTNIFDVVETRLHKPRTSYSNRRTGLHPGASYGRVEILVRFLLGHGNNARTLGQSGLQLATEERIEKPAIECLQLG